MLRVEVLQEAEITGSDGSRRQPCPGLAVVCQAVG